jgi:hypothetical protein
VQIEKIRDVDVELVDRTMDLMERQDEAGAIDQSRSHREGYQSSQDSDLPDLMVDGLRSRQQEVESEMVIALD